MGQYLSIGIAKDIRIKKENLDDKSFEDLKPNLSRAGCDLSIYEVTINENILSGTLQNQLLETELLPFLEKIYALLRKYTGLSDDEKVLEKVKEVTDWQEFLEDVSYYDFQMDRYAHGDRIYIERWKNQRINIDFNAVSFKMAGKIIMESDEGLFDLFTDLLRQQLADFELAKALKVYITG